MSRKHEIPIDIHIDEREWQAQERALQEERLHLTGDPRLAAYRRIARALRQPLPDALPADFARRLAASSSLVIESISVRIIAHASSTRSIALSARNRSVM